MIIISNTKNCFLNSTTYQNEYTKCLEQGKNNNKKKQGIFMHPNDLTKKYQRKSQEVQQIQQKRCM